MMIRDTRLGVITWTMYGSFCSTDSEEETEEETASGSNDDGMRSPSRAEELMVRPEDIWQKQPRGAERESCHSEDVVYVKIEGIIAGGKSTLINDIRDKYRDDPRVLCVNEPVHKFLNHHDFNCLRILEESPYTQAGIIQACMIHILSHFYKSILANKSADVKIIILDRYITSSEIFIKCLRASGYITYFNEIVLLEILRDYMSELPKPSMIFYLDRDVDWRMKHIKERSREGERSTSPQIILQS